MLSVSNRNGVQHDYRPTVEKHPKRGRLTSNRISFDTTRQELRLYYDSHNVAIYYTESINNANLYLIH